MELNEAGSPMLCSCFVLYLAPWWWGHMNLWQLVSLLLKEDYHYRGTKLTLQQLAYIFWWLHLVYIFSGLRVWGKVSHSGRLGNC